MTSTPTVTTNATRDLAAYIVDFQWADVPASTQRRVLDITVDGVAAGLFGSQLPWSRKAVDGLARLGSSGMASVWGHGRSMGLEHAAMLNSSFIQGFELDDYHEFGPMHVAAAIVPPVLAWAESAATRPDPDELLAALAVGMEVGPRLGITIGAYDLLDRGWHCGVIYGSLAAAAALARLAKLDVDQTEDALGIAATQASGLMAAQYEGMVKRIQHGFAARAGLVAVALASAGYTGIKNVLERPYGGFSSTFTPGRDIDWRGMVAGLGTGWEIERDALKAALPQEGSVVLSKADAERWASYSALGKPDDLKTAVAERDSFRSDLSGRDRRDSNRSAADAAGYRPGVLEKLLPADAVTSVREVQVDGRPVKTAFVTIAGTERPLSEWASTEHADFMPSLAMQPQTAVIPAASWVPQPAAMTPTPAGQDTSPWSSFMATRDAQNSTK